jgi:hypothetical protein
MTYKVTIGRDTLTFKGCSDWLEAADRALAWWAEDGGAPNPWFVVEVVL